MKREVSNNTELDRVAAAVVRSSVLRADEIDEIAAGKDLFSAVRKRIAVESVDRRGVETSSPLIFRPRMLAFAGLAAAAVVSLVFVFSILLNRSKRSPIGVPPVPQQARQEDPKPPAFDPDGIETPYVVDHTLAKVRKDRPVPQRISTRNSTPSQQPQEEPVEFYALADMNSTDPVAGGRVIRVDLPRASLVSLGVNVPLGNDEQLVKADLMVGPDGVPRAIRVVQ
jgi:hypothetical protein